MNGRLRVVGLKTDDLVSPRGLDNPQPRLSWRLESTERNVRQSEIEISRHQDCRILERRDQETLIEVGSGTYCFVMRASREASVAERAIEER